MDLKSKGMMWVGNVYQKFEAMCLEVEDIMYQETAKYVESQVQNVGASVKKFYAEVVQDLLPPSSEDPLKNEGSALSLEQNADFGTCEKPKIAIKKDCAKELTPINDPSLVIGVKDTSQEQNDDVGLRKRSKEGVEVSYIKEKRPPFEKPKLIAYARKESRQALPDDKGQDKSHLLPSIAVNHGTMVGVLKQDNNVVVGGRNPSLRTVEGSIKENPPPLEVSKIIAPAGERATEASSLSRLCSENHENECSAPTNIVSPASLELPPCNSSGTTVGACSNLIDESRVVDSSCALPPTSVVLPAELSRSKVVEIGQSSSSGIHLSKESNGIDTITPCHAVSVMQSSKDGHEQCSSHTKLENYISAPGVGSYGNDGFKSGEDIDIGVLGMETIGEFHSAKLDESCIVVDSKELPLLHPKAGKQKSYKKKIHNAFASRMRSSKKQEYEQLALMHGDVGSQHSSSPPHVTDLKLPSHDVGESEWELL